MYQHIHQMLYHPIDAKHFNEKKLFSELEEIAHHAFFEKNPASTLLAHRILYQINMAHLAAAWDAPPVNIMHPVIVGIKYRLEQAWQEAEKQKYPELLNNLPAVSHFESWIKQQVQAHPSNELHPIFTYLRDAATFEQMREFFFQETPLEMLFGDILAYMLPGVYGTIKVAFLKNYWDEVGRARDECVHRNMRARLMKRLQIPSDCYLKQFDLLICEELALINLYLGLATNRAKQTELVGAMLATELMIPGRFAYQIAGWKRFHFDDGILTYLIEHTAVDEVHAEDWLHHVVLPILQNNSSVMSDIALGVMRRLDAAEAVLNHLYPRIQKTQFACVGKFE